MPKFRSDPSQQHSALAEYSQFQLKHLYKCNRITETRIMKQPDERKNHSFIKINLYVTNQIPIILPLCHQTKRKKNITVKKKLAKRK